jgi:ABC-type transport system involved in multi-copper enzyme maturation permease subunit
MSQAGLRNTDVGVEPAGNGVPRTDDIATNANGASPFAHTGQPAIPDLQSTVPWLARVEPFLDYLGDYLNPILVKEARQAMKSRQFSVTFALLLILGWIWTVGFIAFWNVSLYYQSYGVWAISAYYLVLTVPMLIVIPFATFRSLASETEDGTFELMSITTLTARQIVIGKLASAVLQMLVYYSALAPCIAFTYLLRGIDIITIGLLLGHTFLASVLLSVVGLVAATLSRSRMWQVLVSVVLIMGLLGFTWIWDIGSMQVLFEGNGTLPFDEPIFWAINGAAISFVMAFSVLFLFIAAAQITFASENRSTPIRWVLVVIQLLLVGWMVFMWQSIQEDRSDLMLVTMEVLAGIYWMFVGAVLTGETADLSPRAKRHLPQSVLGRSLLTWFNPGSGSGYTFVVLNMAGVVVVHIVLVCASLAVGNGNAPPNSDWFFSAIAILGYVAGYLGTVRLCVSLARRFTTVPMITVFLMHVVVLLVGIFVPMAILSLQFGINAYDFSYGPLQLTNWWWTILELLWRGPTGPVGEIIPLVVLLIGGLIFLANLVDTAGEVEKVRTVAPQRVLEDDAAQRPVPVPKPKNPWDDGTGVERSQASGVGDQEK